MSAAGHTGTTVGADPVPATKPQGSVGSVQFAMGTLITYQAFGGRAQDALNAAQAEVRRLEALLSRFEPTSEISEINRLAGTGSVRVGPETFRVLSQAAEYTEWSDGLLDVTVGPLVSLWRDAAQRSRPPRSSAIERALALVDHSDLLLDPAEQTARLARAGQSIDLGGIGKGFAGDRVLQIYRDYGVFSAFINLGGNVAALGTKPDGSPWQVGIGHPRKEDELLGAVAVTDKAVVTSGDYQRCFFGLDGARHHHILDPSTGSPARSELSSVTVVADSSTLADALSTIVFVAGPGKGLAFVRSCPGVEAVLVDMDMQVYLTSGLEDCFQSADSVDVRVI